MWNIEKLVSKGDYNYAVVRFHPHASKQGYVLEHRVIMENHLGRLLKSNEVVHHLNEDKKDNRLENLQLMTSSEHAKLHATTGRSYEILVCPNCGKEFKKWTNQIKPGTSPKCSRKCNGEYSRKLQLGRI